MKIVPDNDEDELAEGCPCCGAITGEMGRLGSLVHFRCRDCGSQWHTKSHAPSNDEETANENDKIG